MMEHHCNTRGISLSSAVIAPPVTLHIDNKTLIKRSTDHAVDLYNAVVTLYRETGVKIYANKCVTIVASLTIQKLSNRIPVLQPDQCTKIYSLPLGPNIIRDQELHKIINEPS